MRALRLPRLIFCSLFVFRPFRARAATSPLTDAVLTKLVSVPHISHLQVVGNIDVTIIKEDYNKLQISGKGNLVKRLFLEYNFETMLIAEDRHDRADTARIKIVLWLQKPNIQRVSCKGDVCITYK